jgi:hypothetical protein
MAKRQPYTPAPTIVNFHYAPETPLLPDGRPLPDICTSHEVIQYLRLDVSANASQTGRPNSLEYMRERGILVGMKIGRHIRYTRKSVLECRQHLEQEKV